jgi:hypothetical protein
MGPGFIVPLLVTLGIWTTARGRMPRLHLAPFRIDVTVPVGHPLCGGWIKPAIGVTEPLYALGVVLLGEAAPVVLCAVDWTGINNEAHLEWRTVLARAAHTTAERVAVHCIHQHNAPFADPAAERLIARQNNLGSSLDLRWHGEVVQRVAEGVKKSLENTHPVTHIGFGQTRVERVASNRRVLGPDGKIKWWRGSACKDAEARALPEGLVDTLLKTVSFWGGEKKLAALHYYATHPMSYYGDGLVSSDFVGIAREARTKEEGLPHLYFTGCAGNIAAGKYNDGDRANRFLLAQRIHAAMLASEREVQRLATPPLEWRTRSVVLPPRSDETEANLLATLADASQPHAVRSRAAMKLSYLQRSKANQPIILSVLHLGERLTLLHLPAESFVEFQLYAQDLNRERFVATAAYGDGGPWYIPVAKAYGEGGYEPGVAFVDPEADELLRGEIKRLLAP